MSSQRVVLLAPASSVHTHRWATALQARGWQITVLTQHPPEQEAYPPEIAVELLPYRGYRGYLMNASAVRKALRRLKPDLLHAHYASGYGLLGALTGYHPYLLSVWGSDVFEFPYQSCIKSWLLRRNLLAADGLASTSRVMAKQVMRLVPSLRVRIWITPFGVDVQRFTRMPDIAARPITIGTVKSLAPAYGVDTLIRSFALLRGDPEVESIDLRLLIVGDGPDLNELRMLAKDLGIEALTNFAGRVAHHEVPDWLARLDVYVALSRFESFGVAVAEASACQLPVVVSDAGGLGEVVEDGVTGFIVPRDDPASAAARLKRLAMDGSLREQLGHAGRARMLKEFAWDHCVGLMCDCYREMIHGAGCLHIEEPEARKHGH